MAPVPAKFAGTARTLELLENRHFVSDSGTKAYYHTPASQVGTLSASAKPSAVTASVLAALHAPSTVSAGSSAFKAAALPLSTLVAAHDAGMTFAQLATPKQVESIVLPVSQNLGVPSFGGVVSAANGFPWIPFLLILALVVLVGYYLIKRVKDTKTHPAKRIGR